MILKRRSDVDLYAAHGLVLNDGTISPTSSPPSQGRGSDVPGMLRTITRNPNNIPKAGPIITLLCNYAISHPLIQFQFSLLIAMCGGKYTEHIRNSVYIMF